MTRRQVLRLLAVGPAGAVFAPTARALGERLVLGRLLWPGAAAAGPERALERLAWEVSLRTSIQASFDVIAAAPGDPALFDTPLVYLWGDRELAPLDERALGALRRYLEFGGLLLADDGSGRPDSAFARSLAREATRLFPGSSWGRLPGDHSVYRSYYLLDGAAGRVAVSPFLEGSHFGDRTPLLLNRNDLLGALAQSPAGEWRYACDPGGEGQRRQALQLAVNVVLYALTVNYKQDQVHLPFILERMRR
jgi:hypothetical protein